MSYYFLYKKKSIPSFLAYFIILLFTVSLSFFLYQNTSSFKSKASKTAKPQQISVANITNESVSIYFHTKEKISAFIKFGPDQSLKTLKLDDRDNKNAAERRIHYFSLHQLEPNTEYTFKIFLAGREYKGQNEVLRFRTLSIDQPQTAQAPIFGKVLNQKLEAAPEVLVTAKLLNTDYSFTALSRSTGEWIVSFPIIVNSRLQEYELLESDLIKLTLLSPQLQQSKVKVRYKDSQPVKTTILGKNYDLTKSGQTLGVKNQFNKDTLISSPRNNAIISSQYPVFRGIASPKALVQLSLKPSLFSTSVTTNSEGEWSYTVSTPLPSGKYQLVVIDRDSQSQSVLAFQIAKSGETVLGEATPSATLILSPTSIPSPTQEPTTIAQPTTAPTEILQSGINNNLLILFASGLSLFGLFLLLY